MAVRDITVEDLLSVSEVVNTNNLDQKYVVAILNEFFNQAGFPMVTADEAVDGN